MSRCDHVATIAGIRGSPLAGIRPWRGCGGMLGEGRGLGRKLPSYNCAASKAWTPPKRRLGVGFALKHATFLWRLSFPVHNVPQDVASFAADGFGRRAATPFASHNTASTCLLTSVYW